MATNNIKIFDENKGNIMSTEEYGTNSQRLNGVQQGIASSMLQNKTLYQLSLVAYAIGQMMVNNGLDANDDNAVSAFVGNLANTIVQKVVDKASTAEAQAGTDANKFMTPATTRAAINVLKATSSMATAGTDTTHWMTPALVKQVVDNSVPTATGYIKVFDQTFNSSKNLVPSLPSIFSAYNDFLLLVDVSVYYSSDYVFNTNVYITESESESEITNGLKITRSYKKMSISSNTIYSRARTWIRKLDGYSLKLVSGSYTYASEDDSLIIPNTQFNNKYLCTPSTLPTSVPGSMSLRLRILARNIITPS